MNKHFYSTIARLFAPLLLATALGGCDGGSNLGQANPSPSPPPVVTIDPVTISGVVSDGPVTGGTLLVFAAEQVVAALGAPTEEGASALATLARSAADGDSFSIDVDGAQAGTAVFLVLDPAGATDMQFQDTPPMLESVAILATAGTAQRINLSMHTTLMTQQVRAGLDPAGDGSRPDAASIAAEIATAQANVLAALGEDEDGEALYPDDISPVDAEDAELIHAASSTVGLLARLLGGLEDASLDAVVLALSADAGDGAIDGTVPANLGVTQETADLAVSMADLRGRGDDEDVADLATGPCSATAVELFLGCDIDVLDDAFEGRATCADMADDDARAECLVEIDQEAEETDEECQAILDARLEVCEALGDAAHEPAFGPEHAASFVDPREIGNSVAANPYFPLLQGMQWVYEGTFEDDDGEEVTETITVTVTDEVKLIDGILCLTVNDIVTEDGELIEDTDDWYAQDLDGNVWYCGEVARNYEFFDGDDPEEAELVDLDGSWKAGRDGAMAGVLMPAAPVIGAYIRQEVLWNEAEDLIEIISTTGTETAPAASCTGDCLVTRDFTPLEPEVNENKYYAPGIGLILETEEEGRVELVDLIVP